MVNKIIRLISNNLHPTKIYGTLMTKCSGKIANGIATLPQTIYA